MKHISQNHMSYVKSYIICHMLIDYGRKGLIDIFHTICYIKIRKVSNYQTYLFQIEYTVNHKTSNTMQYVMITFILKLYYFQFYKTVHTEQYKKHNIINCRQQPRSSAAHHLSPHAQGRWAPHPYSGQCSGTHSTKHLLAG